MAKLSEEEKIIRREERERARLVREALKPIKMPKIEPSERELVENYANSVMDRKASRGAGHQDTRFAHQAVEKTSVKDLWADTDFFFSVVFQSRAQKMEFMRQMKWPVDSKQQVQIVNGIELAKQFIH